MEEKINGKIEEIIEYIISKPVEEVTLDDYTILHEEIKNIRFRQEQQVSSDRLKWLMDSGFPFAGFGSSVK